MDQWFGEQPLGCLRAGSFGEHEERRNAAAQRISRKFRSALRRRERSDRGPAAQQAVKRISRNQHSFLNELNITPLLDLAFVLLVIFIITTPQLSNDLEMNLPTGQKNKNPSPPP